MTNILVPISQLATSIDLPASVGLAYPDQIIEAARSIARGKPVLIDCDKEVAPFLYMAIRSQLRAGGFEVSMIDGRPRGSDGPPLPAMAEMLNQLRDMVRGAVERRVVCLQHLDLMGAGAGGLSDGSKEVIALLYENPEILFLGFADPSVPIPAVIRNQFPHHIRIAGVPRERLRHLVTQAEARKFGAEFNPWGLYKHVSGLNAIRLRRLLAAIDGEDMPDDPGRAYAQIRQATCGGEGVEMPQIDLDRDIGGYAKTKEKIRKEIIDLMARRDSARDADAARALEEIIPKGLLFAGPPGTGKSRFAKAIATSMGATVIVVSGPELKSKWVGESEAALRDIFQRARAAAPSIIIFDEIDSFASARGTYTGSGVEHSMVNQLLTEMDGFRKEEMVFIVGTTNFVESLDPALLRPGRFEFHIEVPYPNEEDREAILRVFNGQMRLGMGEAELAHAVRATELLVPGTGTPWSGDHLNALCRGLKRRLVRGDNCREGGGIVAGDIDAVLGDWVDRPVITAEEELTVATHECGHAIVALHCKHAPPIAQISIRGDIAGALGFVRHEKRSNRYVVTVEELRDDLAILMGGREAEQEILGKVSIGCAADLERATAIAAMLVERLGQDLMIPHVIQDGRGSRRQELGDAVRRNADAAIGDMLHSARERARDIIRDCKQGLLVLRDQLLRDKVIDAVAFPVVEENRGEIAHA